MGFVRVKPRTRSFEVKIELQKTDWNGTKVIIFVKSPDSDVHHRFEATILPKVNINLLAKNIKSHLQAEPEWNNQANVRAIQAFIRKNPERITCP